MLSSIFQRAFRLEVCARVAAVLVAAVVLLASARAEAHRNGIAAQGCSGCHSGGVAPTVTITSSPATIMPGATVMLSVAITSPEGWGGLFMQTDVGTLATLAGQGTQLASGGITHTAPKQAVGGVVTFVVSWTAPATPGGVNVNVWALAANGDGGSRGDGPGTGFEAFAFGCSGTTFIRDFDGDGWGAMSSGYTRNCALPKYYATKDGDCNDSDERIYPGAPEVCNKRDDNCNGMIDENLPILTCHVDMDGDGHGVATGPVTTDCACAKGTAPNTDDCNDNDPTIYGGAMEICDYKDNNCDGRVDEGARVRCGTGWCARLGDSCASTSCTPGPPRAEVCNDFDDDCDGVIDNGSDAQLCGNTGLTCLQGNCVKPGTVVDAGPPPTGAGGASGATGAAGVGGVTGQGGEGAGAGLEGAAGTVVTGSLNRSRDQGCGFAGGAPRGAAVWALAVLWLVARRRATGAGRPS